MGEGSLTSAVLGLLVVGGVGGAIAARLLWLRSDLSPQNWYLALAAASALLVVSIAAALPPALILLAGSADRKRRRFGARLSLATAGARGGG